MARIRNGILGGFSNKVGEVIGQNYAGVSTMRAMPKYVTNPRTPAQEEHRMKMATAASFFSFFSRGFSFSSWNKSSVNNGFNGALRDNLSHFTYDANVGISFDLLALDLGTYMGVPLFSPEINDITLDSVNSKLDIELIWDGESESDWASPEDNILVFAVNEHQVSENQYEYYPLYCDILPVHRVENEYTLSLYVGKDVNLDDYVYVAFGVVAKCCALTGHNPQKPSEVIKIPAKNNIKSVGNPSMIIKIPAKNVVKFSAAETLRKRVKGKS